MVFRNITFKGKRYILVGENEGAIATKKQYKNFEPSYAHLFPDGNISRYGELIGTIADIKFGSYTNLEVESLAGITSPGWVRKNGK